MNGSQDTYQVQSYPQSSNKINFFIGSEWTGIGNIKKYLKNLLQGNENTFFHCQNLEVGMLFMTSMYLTHSLYNIQA